MKNAVWKLVDCDKPATSPRRPLRARWASAAQLSADGRSTCENTRATLAVCTSAAVPGRPPRLTPEPWPHLRHVPGRGARQAGFDTDRWTLRRIRAVILVEFGVTYHAHYLAHRLNTLGWSPQHPAVYARERDEAVVQAWLTQDWPRLKKRLAAEARQSSSSMKPASPFAPRPARPGLRGGTRRSSGV